MVPTKSGGGITAARASSRIGMRHVPSPSALPAVMRAPADNPRITYRGSWSRPSTLTPNATGRFAAPLSGLVHRAEVRRRRRALHGGGAGGTQEASARAKRTLNLSCPPFDAGALMQLEKAERHATALASAKRPIRRRRPSIRLLRTPTVRRTVDHLWRRCRCTSVSGTGALVRPGVVRTAAMGSRRRTLSGARRSAGESLAGSAETARCDRSAGNGPGAARTFSSPCGAAAGRAVAGRRVLGRQAGGPVVWDDGGASPRRRRVARQPRLVAEHRSIGTAIGVARDRPTWAANEGSVRHIAVASAARCEASRIRRIGYRSAQLERPFQCFRALSTSTCPPSRIGCLSDFELPGQSLPYS